MVIQQYQDPSIKTWMKIGFWYQERKEAFDKILLGALIAFSAVFWLYAIYGAVRIAISAKNDEALYRGIEQSRIPVLEIHQARAPGDLIVKDIFAVPSPSERSAIASQAQRADIVAFVENPNEKWVMDIEYYFSWDGSSTLSNSARLLPKETAPLAVLGVSVNGVPDDIGLSTQIRWQKIKDEPKLEKARQAKAGLVVSGLSISTLSGVSDAEIVLENRGIYGIVGPAFLILLNRMGADPYAIGMYQADFIGQGSSIKAQKRWLRSLPQNLNAEAYPIADFLDDSIYRIQKSGGIIF